MSSNGVRTCEECGIDLPNGSERRRFCDASCRARAWRRDSTEEALADVPEGRNLEALDGMLVEIDVAAEDGPMVAAARALARQVDRRPSDSALWSRYLDVLERLREVVGARQDQALAAAMRDIWDAHAAEIARADALRRQVGES